MPILAGPEFRRYFEGNVSEIADDAQFIGRIDGDKLLGVIAVWNWDGRGCEAGWAGEPGWLSRGYLRFVFDYIFGQMGCHRVTGRIDASDAVAIAQTERLGFVCEGRIREAAADGQDILIYGLLKTECRWHGKKAEAKEGAGHQSTGADQRKLDDESSEREHAVRFSGLWHRP